MQGSGCKNRTPRSPGAIAPLLKRDGSSLATMMAFGARIFRVRCVVLFRGGLRERVLRGAAHRALKGLRAPKTQAPGGARLGCFLVEG